MLRHESHLPQNTISTAALNIGDIRPDVPFTVLRRLDANSGFERAESGVILETPEMHEDGWGNPRVVLVSEGVGPIALVKTVEGGLRLDLHRAGILSTHRGDWAPNVFTIEDDTDRANS